MDTQRIRYLLWALLCAAIVLSVLQYQTYRHSHKPVECHCEQGAASQPDVSMIKNDVHEMSPSTQQPTSAPEPAKHNIVFLKTHKTGSCTVQNILFRFGDNRNLTFVMGKEDRFYYPNKISKAALVNVNLKRTPTGQYNILTNHMRFDHKVVKSLMPPDTVYVTLLRDPATAFASAMTYMRTTFKSCFKLKADDIVQEFAGKAGSYMTQRDRMCASDVPSHDYSMFDFGLAMGDMKNNVTVSEKISEIDRVFSLVMITEFFDESLILLKDLLNWSIADVAYFKHNVNKKSKHKMAPDTTTILREWNSADTKVYNFFKEKLVDKLRRYGLARLQEDVEALRALNKQLSKLCVAETSTGRNMSGSNKPYHPDAEGFVLNQSAKENTTCVQLTRAELPYTNLLRRKMLSYT